LKDNIKMDAKETERGVEWIHEHFGPKTSRDEDSLERGG
jgi:hypothetical protein